MDSIEIKIGEHTITFSKQSVKFSGSEYFYGEMSDIVHKTEPIPCYEFTYNGQREALYYNLKNEKVVTSVFNQVIALNRQKEAAESVSEASGAGSASAGENRTDAQSLQETASAETAESGQMQETPAAAANEDTNGDASQIPETPAALEGFPENGESTAEYLVSREEAAAKPKNSRKTAAVIIIAVLIIAAVIVGIVVHNAGKGKETAPTAAVPTTARAEGIYESGTYHVGVDLPKGVYLITGSGYLSVSTDKSGSLENMITNANYTNRYFIQVDTDQYLTFKGKAQLASNAPAYENTETLVSGMYLVGKDLPAGKYTVKDDGDAYVAVMQDAKGTIDSILTNSNFSDRETITVKDGQFIELKNCKIELQEQDAADAQTEETSE